MQLALTLLITAMQLKVALLGLPVQFQAERDNMIPIVDNAISYAQTVINEQSVPIVSTPISQPINFGSTGCIDKPELTLSTTSDQTISDRYVVHAIYSTGCELNSNTPFSYFADSWRTESGIIGNYRNGMNWEYTINAIPNYDSFTMTVGSTTKNF